jgi:hypothetical protein
LTLGLLKLTSSTPTASETICGCGVTGSTKASASEKEEMTVIWLEPEEAGLWKAWKDTKPVCVKPTVLLGRRLNCEVRERALSEGHYRAQRHHRWVR